MSISPCALDRPFALDDLPALGLSPAALRRRLRDGSVRRLLRGVYVAAEVPDETALRVAGVARIIDPTHVVVDRTAAWLHGVDVYSRSELAAGVDVEACALRGRHPTERHGVRGRSRDLSPGDITMVDQMRVTTPLRTALDLGCHLRRREAFGALCGLARNHELEPGELSSAARRFAKRRGVVQLRELVPLVDRRIESMREAWTLLAILDAGMPAPEPQVWVDRDGVPTYRLDLAYRSLRIAIEYDGVEAHGLTEEQRTYDEERRAWLRAEGWTVIVVKAGDFSGSAQDRWLRRLRTAIRDSAYSTRRW